MIGIIAGSLIVSSAALIRNSKKSRHVFYFDSFDTNKVCTEVRYSVLSSKNYTVDKFISDLLLGPMTNRYKALFSTKTVLDFCIEKEGTLYVGLSSSSAEQTGEYSNRNYGIELLKKNITENFSGFDKIYIYIDGELAG